MHMEPLVTCIGEALVDFISTTTRVTLSEAPGFVKVCGGEAANVAVGIAKLGARAAFVGKVGDDSFGRFIVRELGTWNVDVKGVRADKRFKTRLAFVSLTKNSGRDFEFWEQRPAGEQLRYADVPMQMVAGSRIVNIGPLLLLKDPARSTALRVAREARKRGCDVAFDPNLRLSLWRSEGEARCIVLAMIRQCTILRLNDEEAKFLIGVSDVRSAAANLHHLGPGIVIVTLGGRGSYYQVRSGAGFVKGFKVRPVDTTGCGDGFFAGVLFQLAASGETIDSIASKTMKEICRYGNAVGALTALKMGAVAALPSAGQVKRFLKAHRNSVR